MLLKSEEAGLRQLICAHCGKGFYRDPAGAERRQGKPVFCSRNCVNQYRSSSPGPRRVLASQLHEEHPDWSQSRIAREVGVSKQLVNKWFRKGL